MKLIKLINSELAEEIIRHALAELQVNASDDVPITEDDAIHVVNDALIDFYWDADIDTECKLSNDVLAKLNDLADELEKATIGLVSGEISSMAILNTHGDVLVTMNFDNRDIEALYFSIERLRSVIL